MATLKFSPQAWTRWRPQLLAAIKDQPNQQLVFEVDIENIFYNCVRSEGDLVTIRVNFNELTIPKEMLEHLKELTEMFEHKKYDSGKPIDVHFEHKTITCGEILIVIYNKKTRDWSSERTPLKWHVNNQWKEVPDKFVPLIMKAK